MSNQLTREEAIQQQYEIYKQKRTQKETEQNEQKTFIETQKAQTKAYWQNKKANLPTVTTRKPHNCADCSAAIPEGTTVKVSKKLAEIHGNWGIKTVYHCGVCRPVEA